MFAIEKLRCEYKQNPLGIDLAAARISWQLVTDRRDCKQAAYQIQVAMDNGYREMRWDSGRVESSQSIHVEMEQVKPEARTRYYYQIRAWDQGGVCSGWSETAFLKPG